MDRLINFIRIFRPLIPKRFRHIGHFVVAEIGTLFYGLPSRGMMVVGVTGTNGKSTVVSLLHHIFLYFGLRVASISSVYERIQDDVYERGGVGVAKNTMPGWFDLQKFFRRAKKAGCQVVIVEVTSEGIAQHRHRGLFFDRAVLTNLRPEHIESHGSFEAYRDVKGRLFHALRRWKPGVPTASIVNIDDPSAYYYTHIDTDAKWGFGLEKKNDRAELEAIIPTKVNMTSSGTSFEYDGLIWKSGLVGLFNVYNTLCAIAVARSFYIPLNDIHAAIESAPQVPGRLEVVAEKPTVIVDYAHTPDALEAVYENVQNLWVKRSGRLIVVLGATGGGRDRWKRPEFGRIASKYADYIILTNEDPYGEDPDYIVAEIAYGIDETEYEIIIDREKAIHHAIEVAGVRDVVVITGKGSENTLMTDRGPVKWDDREVVEKSINIKK